MTGQELKKVGWFISVQTRNEMKIDEWNTDLIRDHKWSLTNGGHFRARVNGRIQLLHRLIVERMGLDLSNEVDHIDRDKENNHESNLRSATRSQNAMNSKKRCDNTSGHTGVFYNKEIEKWWAYITVNSKRVSLGYFKQKKDAIMARRAGEIKYFGEYRRK